ncbi:hypothetical protein GmHk_11G032039 [Glycine max]|nr:hypothetical protein GmHk_11G032039 [Glycine max]
MAGTLFLLKQQNSLEIMSGPQSMVLAFRSIGQWSEKSLSNTNCVEFDHWDNHSSESKNLSNLLMTLPLGLHHVNLLPTDLTSSKAISEIQELNSDMLGGVSLV